MSSLIDLSLNITLESNITSIKHGFSFKDVTLYSVIFSSIFAFILLFGVLTNFLVIGVFILRSEFRQYTNFFFINLSIADILVLLFCIPITITDLYSPDEWHYGRFYCQMYTFFEYCVTTVSSLTIISISIERYYAVTKPLEVKLLFNRRNSILLLGLIWVVAILISIPFLFVPEYYSHPDYSQCFLNLQPNHMIYVTCLYVILIFAPVIGLSFLYFYIVIKLRKHIRTFKENTIHTGGIIEDNSMDIPLDYSRKERRQGIQYKKRGDKLVVFSSSPSRASSMPSGINSDCGHSKEKEFSFLSRHSTLNKRPSPNNNKPVDLQTIVNAQNRSKALKRNSMFKNSMQLRRTRNLGNNKKTLMHSDTIMERSFSNRNGSSRSSAKKNLGRKINHTILISMVALAFFICQLPLRIFLLWSYHSTANMPPIESNLKFLDQNKTNHSQAVVTMATAGGGMNENSIFYINLTANCSTIIYFLHCISNPIIYNLISVKFRQAFISLSCFR